MNPATGNDEPYYRIKESYRDRLGRVHSLVLLSPGFIKGYSSKELNLTSRALNKLMAHKGESATLSGRRNSVTRTHFRAVSCSKATPLNTRRAVTSGPNGSAFRPSVSWGLTRSCWRRDGARRKCSSPWHT